MISGKDKNIPISLRSWSNSDEGSRDDERQRMERSNPFLSIKSLSNRKLNQTPSRNSLSDEKERAQEKPLKRNKSNGMFDIAKAAQERKGDNRSFYSNRENSLRDLMRIKMGEVNKKEKSEKHERMSNSLSQLTRFLEKGKDDEWTYYETGHKSLPHLSKFRKSEELEGNTNIEREARRDPLSNLMASGDSNTLDRSLPHLKNLLKPGEEKRLKDMEKHLQRSGSLSHIKSFMRTGEASYLETSKREIKRSESLSHFSKNSDRSSYRNESLLKLKKIRNGSLSHLSKMMKPGGTFEKDNKRNDSFRYTVACDNYKHNNIAPLAMRSEEYQDEVINISSANVDRKGVKPKKGCLSKNLKSGLLEDFPERDTTVSSNELGHERFLVKEKNLSSKLKSEIVEDFAKSRGTRMRSEYQVRRKSGSEANLSQFPNRRSIPSELAEIEASHKIHDQDDDNDDDDINVAFDAEFSLGQMESKLLADQDQDFRLL